MRLFAHIDLSELGEGRTQYGWNSQHAVLHVGQPTHAIVHDHVGRVQVAVKHAAVVEEPQALSAHAVRGHAGEQTGRGSSDSQSREHNTQRNKE